MGAAFVYTAAIGVPLVVQGETRTRIGIMAVVRWRHRALHPVFVAIATRGIRDILATVIFPVLVILMVAQFPQNPPVQPVAPAPAAGAGTSADRQAAVQTSDVEHAGSKDDSRRAMATAG